MNLYTIIFKDKEVFKGGTLETPNWINIPDKEISSIFYTLPTGDMLCLANFNRIYHFVEACKDITGKEKGKVKLEYTHILVDRNKKILHYKIDLQLHKIYSEELDYNNSMILELNPIGWKKGIEN
jgi:hypothetical protein